MSDTSSYKIPLAVVSVAFAAFVAAAVTLGIYYGKEKNLTQQYRMAASRCVSNWSDPTCVADDGTQKTSLAAGASLGDSDPPCAQSCTRGSAVAANCATE